MFTRGLSGQTQKNLESLNNISFVNKYYLAGGTALSLHFGHRFSYDLDFFSQTPVNPLSLRTELVNAGNLEILQNEEGTFNGVLNGVKLSFFIYPYPLLYKTITFKEVNIAHTLDIACMKVDAISSRGTKRDFIDLFFIVRKVKRIRDILKLYSQKYKSAKFNILHILKSLVYFSDAEVDKMPQMIEKTDWDEVKQFFVREVKEIRF